MLTEFTNAQYFIQPGRTLSGKLTERKTLSAAAGCLWLTIEGQSQDIWLRQGQSIELPAARLIVIEAHAGKGSFVLSNAVRVVGGMPGFTPKTLSEQVLQAA